MPPIEVDPKKVHRATFVAYDALASGEADSFKHAVKIASGETGVKFHSLWYRFSKTRGIDRLPEDTKHRVIVMRETAKNLGLMREPKGMSKVKTEDLRKAVSHMEELIYNNQVLKYGDAITRAAESSGINRYTLEHCVSAKVRINKLPYDVKKRVLKMREVANENGILGGIKIPTAYEKTDAAVSRMYDLLASRETITLYEAMKIAGEECDVSPKTLSARFSGPGMGPLPEPLKQKIKVVKQVANAIKLDPGLRKEYKKIVDNSLMFVIITPKKRAYLLKNMYKLPKKEYHNFVKALMEVEDPEIREQIHVMMT